MNRTRKSVPACLLGITGAVACSGADSEEVWPAADSWSVAPTPAIEIGVVEGEDAYMFQSVRYARLLADGRVVVADAGQLVIRVYGQAGTFQTEMGGPGDGPGQFRAINGMWLTSEETIGAWDAENRRITTFTAEGDLETTHRLVVDGELPGNLEVFLGSFNGNDIVLASLSLGGDPRAQRMFPDRWVVWRFGPAGELRGSLGELRGMRRLGGQPLPFSALPYAAVYRDSLYVADGYEAQITVRAGSGDVARRIDVPHVAVHSAGAWSSLEAELKRRNHQLHLQLLEKMPRVDEFPQVAGLLIDDWGFIWAKIYEPLVDALWLNGALRPGPGGEWRIVRPDGEFVTMVRIPDGVTPLDVRSDRLVGVFRDALDVEGIVVHRLER